MTTQSSPKKSLLRKRLPGCLVALVVACLGLVPLYNSARWGYYQGLWGKENPVARYLWLCDAPEGFEETLYPDNVEILVPACENLVELSHHSVQFTSDKQYLCLGNFWGAKEDSFWLEIVTGEITERPSNVQYFADQRQEEGEWVDVWFDLDSRERITINPGAVTLMECGQDYDYREGLFSDDKRRIAKPDGIYDAESGEKLLDYGMGYDDPMGYELSIHLFIPCAWLPDNQSVILIPGSPWGLELLIWGWYDEYLSYSKYPVAQPVLKFNVPETYR